MPEPSFPGRVVRPSLLILVILALPACWTPDSVQTQPAGPPRIIQSGIAVHWFDSACKQKRSALLTVFVSRDGMLPVTDPTIPSTRAAARILRVNVSYRTVAVQYPDSRVQTFKVGRDVQLGRMQSGDDVLIQSPDGAASACVS